mmetsp:Transcript_4993/g.13187  ORF Transcript_4993/g.13187 Transcript_4993/m.13187 type:complete len:91 (+) Transcript_4993:86-358(+)
MGLSRTERALLPDAFENTQVALPTPPNWQHLKMRSLRLTQMMPMPREQPYTGAGLKELKELEAATSEEAAMVVAVMPRMTSWDAAGKDHV